MVGIKFSQIKLLESNFLWEKGDPKFYFDFHRLLANDFATSIGQENDASSLLINNCTFSHL